MSPLCSSSAPRWSPVTGRALGAWVFFLSIVTFVSTSLDEIIWLLLFAFLSLETNVRKSSSFDHTQIWLPLNAFHACFWSEASGKLLSLTQSRRSWSRGPPWCGWRRGPRSWWSCCRSLCRTDTEDRHSERPLVDEMPHYETRRKEQIIV